MRSNSINSDSINLAEKALASYQKIVQELDQAIKNKQGKVSQNEITQAIAAIKNTRSEIELHGGKIAISSIPNVGLKTNALNASKKLRATLKDVIETAAQQVPIQKLYAEIGLSEELLEEQTKRKFETVSGVDEGSALGGQQ